MAVSASDAAFFAREGYLVLPGFASEAEVASLRASGAELLASCDPEANPSVFSTKRQTATTDDYFLASGNNVSFFLEEGALDADGRLRVPKELAVNKFGHGACHSRSLALVLAARGRAQLTRRAVSSYQRCMTSRPRFATSHARPRHA